MGLRGPIVTALVLGFLGVPAVAADASPGDLDPSFGKGGIVEVPSGRVVALADGRILVAGTSRTGSGQDPEMKITALEPNGDVDTGFGQDGHLETDSTEIFPTLGSDGFYVLGRDDASHAWVEKFDDSGDRDTDFGENGMAVLPDDTYRMRVDPQGRIVSTTGYCCGPDSLTRLLPSGEPDDAFGIGGEVDLPDHWHPTVVGFAPDGKILMGLHIAPEIGFPNTFVVRLTEGGEFDHSWGDDGYYDIEHGGQPFYSESSTDIDFTGSGDAFVAGIACPSSASGRPCVDSIAKLTTAGEPAPGFPAIPVPSGTQVVLDPQERPIFLPYGRGEPPGIGRLSADGKLDETFGDGGRTLPTYLREELTLSGNPALVASGEAVVASGGTRDGPVVARFLLGDGKDDLDADDVADRRDGCPRFFSDRHRGCPLTGRRLIADVRRTFHGRLEFTWGSRPPSGFNVPIPCEYDQRIQVARIVHGKPERIATVRTELDGSFSYSPSRIRPDTYVITAPATVTGESELCQERRQRIVVPNRRQTG